jgi:UDP-glucose 4-epimerase
LPRTLVTGGAGFIGSHLVEASLARGHEVRVLDNFSTGRRENLAAFLKNIELFEGDLCDQDLVREAMRGVDFVLHQAALPSVQRSLEDPVSTHRVNVEGTLCVLLAARDASVRRLVYASSSSVYGNAPELPKQERHPVAPASPYAAAKLAGEQYALSFYRSFGLETVALRYFNVFGPRQDPESPYAAVIPRFIDAALSGSRPRIFGDGRQSRDFTYVANVVNANLLACERPGVAGEVFNIAAGHRIDLLGVLEQLRHLTGTCAEPEHLPARTGEVRHSQADISRATERLGYRVEVSFQEGLGLTVDWHRLHRFRRPR